MMKDGSGAGTGHNLNLNGISMDMLIHLIRPQKLADGAHELTIPVYNTQVSIKAYPGSHNLSDEALDALLDKVRELAIHFELTLSRTRTTSELSRLNDAHGEPVELSPETFELISVSRAYCEASQGIFDVTMGSVTPLWDFHKQIVPDADELRAALTHVDWHAIEVNDETHAVRLTDPEARLDLGGIAKGYIADRLIDMLVQNDCDCAFVNLGGNVVTLGSRPDGKPWRVGIRDPRNPSTIRAVLNVTDRSVVTSGLYERNFTKDGVMYHHILSPLDGMPVKTDIGGATIVSKKSLDGDGYSTTLFALGVEGALQFIEDHPDLEAVIIDTNDTVYVTSGLRESFELVSRS